MKKIKAILKIPFAWLKLKYKNFFVRKRLQKKLEKNLVTFKKESEQILDGDKMISTKILDRKNLTLYALNTEKGYIYRIDTYKSKAIVHPDHPRVWAINIKNAERKLDKYRCDKCIYIENASGMKVKELACELCNMENKITNVTENLKN